MMVHMRTALANLGKRSALRAERIAILVIFCWIAVLQHAPLKAGAVALRPADSEQLPFHESPMPESVDVDEVESLTSNCDNESLASGTLPLDCLPVLQSQLLDACSDRSPASRTLLFVLQRLRD